MKDLMSCHLINYSMVLSPCKNYLAVSNNFNSIKVINLINEKESCLLKISENLNGNVYNLKNCGLLLLCSSDCYIAAWKWNEIINNITAAVEDTKLMWKETLPQNSEYFGYLQILSMFVDETEMLLYAGSSDGVIHSWKILNDGSPRYLSESRQIKTIAVTLTNGKGFSLIAGCSDGSVRLWDNRARSGASGCLRLSTAESEEVRRPEVGTCVNVVSSDSESADWLLCGGEPKLALWNVRAAKVGVVFEEGPGSVFFEGLLRDQVIVGGGASRRLSLWDMSGQLNSEISLGALGSVYGLLHRDQHTQQQQRQSSSSLDEFFVCGWGPSVELYSGVGYRKRSYEC